jgi:hypothetical protein
MNYIFEKNISEILFDEPIKKAVEYMDCIFPYTVTIKHTVPLTKIRLLSLLELEHETLPPIKINTKGEILDGRHRVATAIIRGKKTIKASFNSITYCENFECSKKLVLATHKSSNKEFLCKDCYNTKCCKICKRWSGHTICEECM